MIRLLDSTLALWTPEASARSASVPEMRAKLRNQIYTFILGVVH